MTTGGKQASAPTMGDVARRAGVSQMTVSNVVNGRTARVGAATRARVLAAIEELGYRVNVSASRLRSGRTGVVALAVPDFSLAYYGELAERLATRFEAAGLRLVLEHTAGRRDGELATVERGHLDQYDGLALVLAAGDAEEVARRHPDRPVVIVGEREVSTALDHVVMDNVGGARAATEYLLSTGARRIAVLGAQPDGPVSMPSLRTRGHVEALAAAGAPVDADLLIGGGVAFDDGARAAGILLAGGRLPDALLAFTDDAALGALHVLATAGVDVPGRLQVVGWDGTRAGRFATPALSTVDPDNDAIADAIVRLLVRRIEGGPSLPREVVMPPARLELRGTTR
ncbi:LacI family DNA-binding transcriptional regulator [Schumannella luteola]